MSYEGCIEKKIKNKKYFAAKFIISDDIEKEIIVLSDNWRFSLSPFIK